MSSVRAVLFDYGLVLCGPPHPPAWERMRLLLGVDDATMQRAYWEPRVAYDRGELDGVAYWHRVGSIAGKSDVGHILPKLIDADTQLWTQPNEAMIDWAADLHEAGLRIGILSNLGDAMELGVRRQCPWLESFHHLTFSHNLKMGKPDRAIYDHAAQGLGVPAEEILFIDDREDNIAGARAAGMQAVQYGTHEQFERDMQSAGLGALLHPTIRSAEPQ